MTLQPVEVARYLAFYNLLGEPWELPPRETIGIVLPSFTRPFAWRSVVLAKPEWWGFMNFRIGGRELFDRMAGPAFALLEPHVVLHPSERVEVAVRNISAGRAVLNLCLRGAVVD